MDPSAAIVAANDAIKKAGEDHVEATKNSDTATKASDAVSTIQGKLSSQSSTTSSGRVKRQSSSTVGPVSDCDDFSTKYKQLLAELKNLSDESADLNLIDQLVAVLNAVTDIPCDGTKLSELSSETQADAKDARSKATAYVEKKKVEIGKFVEIIQVAIEDIGKANEKLKELGSATIPVTTTNLTTEIFGGNQ